MIKFTISHSSHYNPYDFWQLLHGSDQDARLALLKFDYPEAHPERQYDRSPIIRPPPRFDPPLPLGHRSGAVWVLDRPLGGNGEASGLIPTLGALV